MKHFNTLFTFLLTACFFVQATAQERFLEPVFDEVTVTQDLSYGANYTILTLAVPGIEKPVLEPLLFDFYEPAGDDLEERPLVILMKTGNFLPIQTNGTVQGTKRDSATVEIAMRLAKHGYVVASIDYRLGWNPTSPTQPERALQLIQAAYRGVQDARTAVRYFKREYTENSNSFGVDTSRITLWGMGTGGYISMGAMGLTDPAKITNTTNPAGKFLFDFPGLGLQPMVNPAFNGDIFGTSLGIIPLNLPPFTAGDTLCVPNHVGYSSEYQLTVNGAGALGDISWLEQGQTPLIAYHVPTDPNAPYGDDVLRVPTTGDLIVQVQGSLTSVAKANADTVNNNSVFAGVETMFPDQAYVATITQAAVDASAKAAYDDQTGTYTGHDYVEGLLPILRPEGQGDPWNWWEPSRWDTVPNLLADPGGSINFHQSALASQPDMSPEKARTYIDTIMWYFLPRAYMALNLDAATGVKEVLSQQEVGLQISPNPASAWVRFQTNQEHPMRHILIYDMAGRLVRSRANVNASFAELSRGALAPGNYVAYIRFDDGIASQQILFR